MELCETCVYSVDEPFDAPISAIGDIDDTVARPAEPEAWRYQTLGSFTLRTFPSSHFYWDADPTLLLRAISQHFDAQRRN